MRSDWWLEAISRRPGNIQAREAAFLAGPNARKDSMQEEPGPETQAGAQIQESRHHQRFYVAQRHLLQRRAGPEQRRGYHHRAADGARGDNIY